MEFISYRCGYKYQLASDYRIQLFLSPWCMANTEYIQLDSRGVLTIKEGYAWDGPSGPTADTKDFMRGSLVHDALYQLMREGYLDHRVYRKQADQLLVKLCREDGMSWLRARVVYLGVRWFADSASEPKNEKPIVQAP